MASLFGLSVLRDAKVPCVHVTLEKLVYVYFLNCIPVAVFKARVSNESQECSVFLQCPYFVSVSCIVGLTSTPCAFESKSKAANTAFACFLTGKLSKARD